MRENLFLSLAEHACSDLALLGSLFMVPFLIGRIVIVGTKQECGQHSLTLAWINVLKLDQMHGNLV